MKYRLVLTFEAVNEILKCGHSNESYWAILSCGPVHSVLYKVRLYCLSHWMNTQTIEQCFTVVPCLMHKVVLVFESVGEP